MTCIIQQQQLEEFEFKSNKAVNQGATNISSQISRDDLCHAFPKLGEKDG